jgi:uncharacterized RDD family membrane protein YckC
MTVTDEALGADPRVANWAMRATAFAIDLALLTLVLLAGRYLLNLAAGAGLRSPVSGKTLAWLVATLLVAGCWKVFGATPGKMVCSLRVVDAKTGDPLSLGQCMLRWVSLLASAVPFGAGLHWAAVDPKRQGVHDKLAGSLVVVRASEARRDAAPRALSEYLRLHWRGELPLATSFYVNTVLLLTPLLMALVSLNLMINVEGEHLQGASIMLLLLWCVTLSALAWSAIGSWRAVQAAMDDGLDSRVALALLLGVGLLAGLVLGSALLEFAPRLNSYLTLARGEDPVGHADLSVSPDGRRLRLSGALGGGDSVRFLILANQAPGARTLEVESPGGRLHEAQRIAEFVRAQHWLVRVTGACDGPCVLLLLAGAQNQLMPGATLGLHGLAPGMFGPLTRGAARQALAPSFEAMGMPPALMQRMLDADPDAPWRPSRRELLIERVIDAPQPGLGIKLPADPKSRTLAELSDLLRGNPAWYALDQRYPGTVDKAAERMANAGAEPGATDDLIEAQGQSVFMDLLPRLLQETDGVQRMKYASIWGQELAFARDINTALCASLLSGNAAVRPSLPDDLATQEAEWIVDAANVADQVPRAVTVAEAEVIRHQLGDRAPEIIGGLMLKARNPKAKPDCERSMQILDMVNAMPPRTRELAAHALFQD